MNIQVEEIGPCRRKFTIEIPVEKVAEEYQSVLSQYAKSARIKGFRPGKAPAKVVGTRYANEIRQDVKDRLIPEGYRTALKQESMNPVAVLDITNADVNLEQAFLFSITCDVAPEFNVPEYQGIQLENRIDPVLDDEIESALEYLRESRAAYIDVQREVREDDVVQIDYVSRIDGKALSETSPASPDLDQAKDVWLSVDENVFLPELREGLRGAKAGETIQINAVFADDFRDEALRGKHAVYTVDVKQVREKKIPDLDETLLQQLGVVSIEELRRHIADDLERRNEARIRQDFCNQILAFLMEHTALDLPESVVQKETRTTIYDMVREFTQRGTSADEVEDRKSEIFDQASRSAEEKVKIRYILSAIAGKKHIEVSDEELDQRIMKMARQYESTPDQLRTELKKRDQIENLRSDVLFEKTLDFLLEQAHVEGTVE